MRGTQFQKHVYVGLTPRAPKSALAIRDMKTQWILTILCCRVRRRVVLDPVSASLRATRGAILGRFVPQMTVCVTFGAPLLDVHFRDV